MNTVGPTSSRTRRTAVRVLFPTGSRQRRGGRAGSSTIEALASTSSGVPRMPQPPRAPSVRAISFPLAFQAIVPFAALVLGSGLGSRPDRAARSVDHERLAARDGGHRQHALHRRELHSRRAGDRGGALLDPTTGAPNPGFPTVLGQVHAAIPDGAGGFYLGRLVHGGRGAWRDRTWRASSLTTRSELRPEPGRRGRVAGAGRRYALRRRELHHDRRAAARAHRRARRRHRCCRGVESRGRRHGPGAGRQSATTVFAGGAFTQVGGQTRNGLAAIGAMDGVVTAWDPAPSGPVGRSRSAAEPSGSAAASSSSVARRVPRSRRSILRPGPRRRGTPDFALGSRVRDHAERRRGLRRRRLRLRGRRFAQPSRGARRDHRRRDVMESRRRRAGARDRRRRRHRAGGRRVRHHRRRATRNFVAALDGATGNAAAWDPNAGGPCARSRPVPRRCSPAASLAASAA